MQRVFSAISKGNIDTVKTALDNGVYINYRNRDNTLLTQAIRTRRPRIVELLLSRGADPNLAVNYKMFANDNTIYSPLYFAVFRSGNEEIVELLFKYGADPNTKLFRAPNRYENMLIYSVIIDSIDDTRYLRLFLKYGANVTDEMLNYKGNYHFSEVKDEIQRLLETALHKKAIKHNVDTLNRNIGVTKTSLRALSRKNMPPELQHKIMSSAIPYHPPSVYDRALSPSSRRVSQYVRKLRNYTSMGGKTRKAKK